MTTTNSKPNNNEESDLTELLCATALIKNAIISKHALGTSVDISESDRVLYSGCEFRGVTVIFRGRVSSHALHNCLLIDCEIIFPEECSRSKVLLGFNTALDCKFNGERVADFRTNT